MLSNLFSPCFFGHKWSKWTQYSEETLFIRNGKSYNGFVNYQSRNCQICNKLQKEEI